MIVVLRFEYHDQTCAFQIASPSEEMMTAVMACHSMMLKLCTTNDGICFPPKVNSHVELVLIDTDGLNEAHLVSFLMSSSHHS